MNQRQEYRELIRIARQLGAMDVDRAEARAASEAVRRQLRSDPASAAPLQGSRAWFTGKWVWISGSVAAAIVVGVVAAFFLVTLPRPVDAAEQLRASSRATSNYQGWVHVTFDMSQVVTGVYKLMAGDAHIHFNNVNGDLAIEFKVLGSECIMMVAADAGKEMEYIGLTGELQVSPISKDQVEAVRRSVPMLPVNPEDAIAKTKSEGWPDPIVTKSSDHGLDRFDVQFKGYPATQPASKGNSPIWSMTIWSDPESKLIQRMVMIQDGKPATMTFTYGDPDIRDIYDLGAPRNAKVIEVGPAAEAATPTVMQMPDMSRLVKDNSASVDELRARIQGRANAAFGDFVSVECEELVIPGRVSDRHGMITMIASQGDKGFNDRFEVAPVLSMFGGAAYPAGWPQPKLADVLATAGRAFHDSVVVYNGNTIWGAQASTIDKAGKSHGGPTTQFSPETAKALRTSGLDLGRQLWPDVSDGVAFGIQHKPVFEILREPSRPGLVILYIRREYPAFMTATSRPATNEDYYWLDPKRDDLPMEMLGHNGLNGDATSHIVYAAFSRLADGRWYPTHWQDRTIFPPSVGASAPGYEDHWREVFQGVKPLGDEWFTDPARRLKTIESLFSGSRSTTTR
jgi:hypothetical protein